jgi:hypothetical protein
MLMRNEAALREWLFSMGPMPEPEMFDNIEVSVALMLIAQGLMACFEHCCHPALRDQVAQDVAEGSAEIAKLVQRYKAYGRRHGLIWLD